jgi:arsenic resistance protein ArsH
MRSFNAVNQLRVLGRWMRMLTIPNQSSVDKAFPEIGDDDRMKLPRSTSMLSTSWRNW